MSHMQSLVIAVLALTLACGGRFAAPAAPPLPAVITDLADVRDDQVALWGASYGGFLTGLALGTASAKFSGGVDVCGVSGWSKRVTGADPADAALIARWAPLAFVDTWTAPVLLIHGDDDRNVEFQDSLELAQRLRDLGRAEVALVVMPGEDHFFFKASSWDEIVRRSIEFYDRLLVPDRG